MVEWNVIQKLMNSFPKSIINQNGEFIAHIRANEYFILRDCETELDVKCKVLEWLSRGAYKTQPYARNDKNTEFHRFMRGGINEFLGVHFSEDDIETIYTYLGNACNHKRTIDFIESGYDMKFFERLKEVQDE